MKWYFFEKNDPTKEITSPFSDSKFSIDKWTSFTREIIQNSIDAVECPDKPVIVNFSYKMIKKEHVPGIKTLENVIEKCLDYNPSRYVAENYKMGLRMLKNEELLFIKVSDYNTKGVCQNINGKDAWKALVINVGESVKESESSGGSHGVGKNAPFLMSPIHTVYYSTYNKEENQLFQGKTILTDWEDDDSKRRSGKGWFGATQEENGKLIPLPINNNFSEINSYFYRQKKDGYGTDVIMAVLENPTGSRDEIKRTIINSVLENFFIAILQGKLIVSVFEEKITTDSYDNIMSKYYINKTRQRDTGSDTIKFGNLENYTNAYKNPHDIKKFEIDNLGKIIVYFRDDNNKNKKEYAIVRSHGMKIKDVRLQTDKPYSAVVFIEGERLNEYLLGLENAAHDNFVVPEHLSKEEETERLYHLITMKNKIKKYIESKTKIEVSDIQDLEGLKEMIEFVGELSDSKSKSANIQNVKPKKPKIYETHNSLYSSSPSTPSILGGNLVGRVEGKDKKGRRRGEGYGNPAVEGDKREGLKLENFILAPYFIYQANKCTYILNFETREDFADVKIKIFAINSDQARNTIDEFISEIYDDNGNKYKIADNTIGGLELRAGERVKINIKFKGDFKYQLTSTMEGIRK